MTNSDIEYQLDELKKEINKLKEQIQEHDNKFKELTPDKITSDILDVLKRSRSGMR